MHGRASLAPRTAHPRTCTWPSIPCAAPHSYLFTLHLTHAPRPSHMHPGPHTCTPALTHAPRPSHMHPGPHTCTPALTHVPRPSHVAAHTLTRRLPGCSPLQQQCPRTPRSCVLYHPGPPQPSQLCPLLQLLAPAWSSTMGQIGPPPRRSRSNSRKRAGRCLYLCQRWGALALDQGVTGSGGHWIWIGDALA